MLESDKYREQPVRRPEGGDVPGVFQEWQDQCR